MLNNYPRTASVKNPLTIIAIFAGLAEVSGTAILPLFSDETQAVYVWFLMLFPCILVIIFFITLNFRHHVLYAPSDFKDETLFTSMFERRLDTSAALALTEDPVDESDSDLSASREQASTGENEEDDAEKLYDTDDRARAFFAEELAIDEISNTYNTMFERNVRLRGTNVDFDAVSVHKNEVTAIEITYRRSKHVPSNTIKMKMRRLMRAYKSLTAQGKIPILIWCFVIDAEDYVDKDRFGNEVLAMLGEDLPHVRVVVYTMSELKARLKARNEARNRRYFLGEPS